MLTEVTTDLHSYRKPTITNALLFRYITHDCSCYIDIRSLFQSYILQCSNSSDWWKLTEMIQQKKKHQSWCMFTLALLKLQREKQCSWRWLLFIRTPTRTRGGAQPHAVNNTGRIRLEETIISTQYLLVKSYCISWIPDWTVWRSKWQPCVVRMFLDQAWLQFDSVRSTPWNEISAVK